MSDRPISVVPRYRENEEPHDYEQHPVEFEQPPPTTTQPSLATNIWSVLYDYRIIIVCVIVFIIILLVAWYIFAKPVEEDNNNLKKPAKEDTNDKSGTIPGRADGQSAPADNSGQTTTTTTAPTPPAPTPAAPKQSVAELRAMVAQSRAKEVASEGGAEVSTTPTQETVQNTVPVSKFTSEPSVTDEQLASLMETASDIADEDEHEETSVTDLPEIPLNPAQCSFVLASGTQCKVAPKVNGRCTRHAKQLVK